MAVLRKFLAIALLALFGLPFASSLFALQGKSESRLPACCRRNGKHHCAMSMAERAQAQDGRAAFRPVADRCPYCPATLVPSHTPVSNGVTTGQRLFAGLASHPAVHAQAESRFRVARDRARGKRGPPARPTL